MCMWWILASYILGVLTVIGGFMVWLAWVDLKDAEEERWRQAR